MKLKTISLTLALFGILAFTSCSQCYDCTYEVEIVSNGDTITEPVTDEVCTSDQQEIDDREAAGQDCKASV